MLIVKCKIAGSRWVEMGEDGAVAKFGERFGDSALAKPGGASPAATHTGRFRQLSLNLLNHGFHFVRPDWEL